ncbi:pilus assembly protein PilM [Candidatus Saccharibacteria bacterium]|nr:MAG: pilus assembly protein PilM [Candidatus Saccharibacteria bacterium]
MSSIFYKNKPLIGLDISKTSIKVVSIDTAKMLVHGYGSIELDPEKMTEELEQSEDYLVDKVTELFKNNITGKLDSNRVVMGVPTVRTFSRTFSIPSNQEGSIKNAVNLEAEQYIPMPLDSLYIDHQIIKRDKKQLTVLMCAVPKKFVDSLVNVSRRTGIEIDMIEPGMNAVSRLLKHTEEGNLPTIIVDIGPATTDIAILDGAIRVTGGISIGGNTLTLDMAKKMDLPLETAHQLKVLNGLSAGPRQAKIASALKPSLGRMVGEVQKVIRYYTDRFPEESKIEQVIIVGSGSNMPGLGEFFTNELVMPARVASPWQALDFGQLPPPAKQLRPRFMTAAGLGLIKPEDVWK